MLLLSNNYDISLGKICFPLLLSLFLTIQSCSQHPEELQEINSLISTKPSIAYQHLKKIGPDKFRQESEKAYYTYLLYKSAEATSSIVHNDSLIQDCIRYYKTRYDKNIIAECCYLYGHQLMQEQSFASATNQLLLAESYINQGNNTLLAKINMDLSTIAVIQGESLFAENKAKKAKNLLASTDNSYYKSLAEIYLSRTSRFKNNLKTAISINKSLLTTSTNKELIGLILYENGMCYYRQKKFDSAQYYLKQSLKYPFKGTNYSIRCVCYADLLFDKGQYDSAYYYADLSLKYRGSYFNRRDAYRIMTNYMYMINDIKTMGMYMTNYQNYNDSVRVIENQDKVTTLEKIFIQSKENDNSHKQLIVGILAFLIAGFSAGYIIMGLNKKNRKNKDTLQNYKQELSKKNQLVVRGIMNKIEQTRLMQSAKRKKADPLERMKLDKEILEISLNIHKPEVFTTEMNAAFNNIVDVLSNEYEGITWKEIVWCCMLLLDIPNTERLHALETTPAGMYKLKQRLAIKLNLKSAREVDKFLRKFE